MKSLSFDVDVYGICIGYLLLSVCRFNIPDPQPLSEATNDVDADPSSPIIRDDLKRFRLEYKKPTQIR